MLLLIVVVSFCSLFCGFSNGQYINDSCTLQNNEHGRCVKLRNCTSALDDIVKSIHPKICGFDGTEPIVCCKSSDRITTSRVSNNGMKSRKYCEYFYEYKLNNIPLSVTGGETSLAREFPHMAALGFGDEDSIEWQCGGSLISDQYVLTAGHCVYSRNLGEVKWVRVGDLDLQNTTDDALPQTFKIRRRILHPEYEPPLQYNDIALLELDGKAAFTHYVQPICLLTTRKLPEDEPVATGWGHTEFCGKTSDVLMKVTLNYFNHNDCKNAYLNNNRRLPQGIIDESQICAGGIDEEKDTCQGDSGGPLQIYYNSDEQNSSTNTLFHLVGITSFGKACGFANSPGVYTRVSHYVPWIESIVWPN